MRVTFCGVGALGSHAVMLCRNLPATLRLVDFDRVESKNLAAQAFVKASIGKNKAVALKMQLATFFGLQVEAVGVRIQQENTAELLLDADLLVDAMDNAASRNMVSAFARQHQRPLVHAAVAADGTFGIIRWDEHFTADAEDEPGQATCEGGEHLPLLGVLSATLARTVQDFVASGVQRNAMVSLSGVTRT